MFILPSGSISILAVIDVVLSDGGHASMIPPTEKTKSKYIYTVSIMKSLRYTG